MPGGFETELARRSEIEQPGREHTILDDGAAPVGDALGVERPRIQPAPAMRILDDDEAAGKDLLAELVLEKARTARDGGAGDRPHEMPQQTRGDPRIVHHRHLARRYLARAQTVHRALASPTADHFRVAQVAAVDGRREVVVALHVLYSAGDHRDA